jgi:superfamily II DNA/RNA helicase
MDIFQSPKYPLFPMSPRPNQEDPTNQQFNDADAHAEFLRLAEEEEASYVMTDPLIRRWARLIAEEGVATMTIYLCEDAHLAKLLSDELRRHGIRCQYISNTMPADERARTIRRYNEGEIKFVSTSCAIGEEMGLPETHKVEYMDQPDGGIEPPTTEEIARMTNEVAQMI